MATCCCPFNASRAKPLRKTIKRLQADRSKSGLDDHSRSPGSPQADVPIPQHFRQTTGFYCCCASNLLIATTALVATAGIAAAETSITITGMARMGAVSSETAGTAAVPADVNAATLAGWTAGVAAAKAEIAAAKAAVAATLQADPAADVGPELAEIEFFEREIAEVEGYIDSVDGSPAVAKKRTNSIDNRVQFDLRGRTEVGDLVFGGHIRMRGTNGVTTLNGGQVSMSTAGLTVFAGNIPGPLESMANVYGYTVGYSGGTFQGVVNQVDSMAYSSNGSGANAIQANYSIAGLTVRVAHQPSTENNQASIEYSNSGLTVAVGAQMASGKADDMTVATLGYSMGDIAAAVGYSDNNGNTKATISATAKVADGFSLTGYFSDLEGAKEEGYGLGFSYDLGAGARLAGAYENTFAGGNRAELGVTFSF